MWLVPLQATWSGVSTDRVPVGPLKDSLILVLTYPSLPKHRFPPVKCYWECFVELVATRYLDFNPSASQAVSGKKSCSGGLNFVGVGLFVLLWGVFF